MGEMMHLVQMRQTAVLRVKIKTHTAACAPLAGLRHSLLASTSLSTHQMYVHTCLTICVSNNMPMGVRLGLVMKMAET